MMINIDLNFLKEQGLNINEYLTLFKIKELEENNNPIPFNTTGDILHDLNIREYIIYEEKISLTNKGKEIFESKVENIERQLLEEDITEVLNYFKDKTGKKILETSPSNRKFVRDRLKESYTVEDLKAVINLKTKEWAGTSMDGYLRIQTLFNDTKFQKYINAINLSKRREESSFNVRKI